jgi:uncharacterized protein (DUF2164 family)
MPRIELSKEQKKRAVDEIKDYFYTERDEEMGDLAADMLLDFISDKLGPCFYNQAVSDVQRYMSEKVEDLFALMK